MESSEWEHLLALHLGLDDTPEQKKADLTI